MATLLDPPATRRGDAADDYHGTRVADPYRWLEAPADTPEVRAWIEAQNAHADAYLRELPGRARLRDRLTEIWRRPTAGVPFREGGRWFQFRNRGDQDQDVLYVSEPDADDPSEADRALLDPNLLSDDGTAALTGLAVSPDGSLVAYAISEGGSDWKTWRVRDVATGTDRDDVVPWSKFGGAVWLPDGRAFLYVAYPAPGATETYTEANRAPRIALHRLGTPAAHDATVLTRPDEPDWLLWPERSDDGRWLFVHVARGTDPANQLWARPLDAADWSDLGLETDFQPIQPGFDGRTVPVGVDGTTLVLHTDAGAERGRIVATELRDPTSAVGDAPAPGWRELVPEGPDTLDAAVLQGDGLVVAVLHDARHVLRRYRRGGDGNGDDGDDGAYAFAGELELPTVGTVAELGRDDASDAVFFAFGSFLVPPTPYRLGPGDARPAALEGPGLDLGADAYVVEPRLATSRDGTRVPLFVVHRRDLVRDGARPTLLYGYGGFNSPTIPSFRAHFVPWLEQGGVLALASLRGGGEYGRAWHDGGRLRNKQNVFDDAVACAEDLMAAGITNRDRLAVEGRSNGGLLVGALLTQRPDLFGAAHAGVGVLDMLRYHRFTIGWAWASDYGRADDPAMFEVLHAYSPLHNVRPDVSYPPLILTTGDRDDRVVPSHSFKFAAAMQDAQGGGAPILLRVETRGGHGAGKPRRLVIEESADVLAFLADAVGLEVAS